MLSGASADRCYNRKPVDWGIYFYITCPQRRRIDIAYKLTDYTGFSSNYKTILSPSTSGSAIVNWGNAATYAGSTKILTNASTNIVNNAAIGGDTDATGTY